MMWGWNLHAQTTLPAIAPDGTLIYPEEAPAQLFQYSLGDAEVDFFLLGSWEASLGFAAGWTWVPNADGGYDIYPYPPSSIQRTPLTNVVDLVVSLWLDNHYFFESSFRSGFSDNSILAGYYGDGILREFKVGNTDIGLQDYPYLSTAGGITGSPGISAVFAGDRSMHEVMLKYESSSEVRRYFQGNREYSSGRVEAGGFIHGKYFLLPDRNPDTGSLIVWLEADRFETDFGDRSDQDDNGEWYRRLRSGTDYGFDPDNGTLQLAPSLPRGRVLVYYEKGSNPVGTFSSEIPFSALDIITGGVSTTAQTFSYNGTDNFDEFISDMNTILGGAGLLLTDFQRSFTSQGISNALILFEPGLFSPFEIQAWYNDDSQADRVQLIDATGSIQLLNFDDTSGSLHILPDSDYDPTVDPWKLRYPLLDSGADPTLASMYGPGSPAPDNSAGNRFWLEFTSDLGSGFTIDDDIVPGTMRVYRNGELTDGYQFADGILTLDPEPSPFDRITIVYRKLDDSGQSGNLLAASGNRFDLGDAGSLSVALAGSLGVEKLRYSEIPGNNPGYLQLSAGYNYTNDNLNFSIEGTAGVFSADTRGEFRPGATAAADWNAPMNVTNLYPSAPPEEDQIIALNASTSLGLTGGEFSIVHLGALSYRNFRDSLRGAVLSRDSYNTTTEPDPVPGATGPYPVLAAESDPVEGLLSAMEFSMADDQWVGEQFSSGESAPGLLRGFSIDILPEQLTGTNKVYLFLQIGDIGEDLDADNVLDYQASPEDQGFAYNPGGADLLAGYPGAAYTTDWQGLSEDGNGNGILDENNSGGIITRYLGSISAASSSWTSYSGTFTAGELKRLSGTPGVRIILYSGDGFGGNDGRFFISRPVFQRSNAILRGDSVTMTEITDTDAGGYKVDWSFSENDFQLLMDLGSPQTGTYGVLDFSLNAMDDGHDDDFNLYINDIFLASVPLANGDAWRDLQIDFQADRLSLRDADGISIYSSNLPGNFIPGTLNYVTFAFSPSATGIGSVKIGKPVFSHSRTYFAGAVKSSLDFTPEALSVWDDSPWQTSLDRLRVSSSLASGGLEERQGSDSSLLIEGRLPLSAARIDSRLFRDYANGYIVELSHQVRLDGIPGLQIVDDFRHFWDSTGNISRLANNFSLDVSALSWLDLTAEYLISEDPRLRNRSWKAGLDLKTQPLGWDSRIDLSNDEELDSGFRPADHWYYFADYLDSMGLIDWSRMASGDYIRKTDFTTDLKTTPGGESGPVSFSFSLNGDSRYTALPYSQMNTGLEHSAGTALHLSADFSVDITAAQSYQLQDRSSSPDFAGDINRELQRIAAAPALAVPRYIYGIFSAATDDLFFSAVEDNPLLITPDSASQLHSFGMIITRTSGSQLRDLFIPASVELNMKRQLQWENALTSDVRSVDATLGWQALNLFGNLGRYRILHFYNTDEWYAEQTFTMNLDNNRDWKLESRIDPSFYEMGAVDSMENGLSFKYSSSGETSWYLGLNSDIVWNLDLKENEKLSNFFHEHSEIESNLVLRNTESLKLGFGGYREAPVSYSQTLSEAPGFSINISHNSSLELSDLGSFSLGVKIAYANLPVSELNYRLSHTLGIEIDALLKLSY